VANLVCPRRNFKYAFPGNKTQWDAFKNIVPEDLHEFVDDLVEDFTICHLPISHFEGADIKPDEFQSAIEGALVEVQFTLWNIHGQGLVAEPRKVKIIKEGT
jgi:hypothetical protein